ncbi:hypothetical protein C8J57DRAFT_1519965 [Mycena rebaudengoi]|nr:hypothetical protein C8J57DRAFT_1519965 [Mycena rebaudengoi]
MADLVPISKEMEAAYSAGSRSVAVTFTVDEKRSEQLYHFSKIRLFIHINNYQVAVQSTHDLVHHLSTSSIVSSGFFSAFITLPILSAIRGLRGSTFPLWKLSCLLREEWLHDDVLNALAELIRSPRLFSLDLIALRQRLQSTLIDKNFTFSCLSDHYSAYRVDADDDVLVHGDSMRLSPDPTLISAFEWLLSDTGTQIPLFIRAGNVSRQNSASGSCGIASLNFVEIDLDPGAPKWTNSNSPFFRDRALRDLVVYHLIALVQGDEMMYADWAAPCLLQFELSDYVGPYALDGPFGFDDFNLDYPTDSHPIHEFLKVIIQEPALATKSTLVISPRSAFLPPLSDLITFKSSRINLDRFTTPELWPSSIIDLCTPSPRPVVKSEVIDLTLTPVQLKPPGSSVKFKIDDDTTPPKIDTSRSETGVIDVVRLGSFFSDFEKAKATVYALQALTGHVWHIGQTKRRNTDAEVSRVSLRCNHYGPRSTSHLLMVDPSDHRTGCSEHVNLTPVPGGGWHITVLDFEHNHPPEIPEGGHIQLPPTDAQCRLVAEYAVNATFSRSHTAQIPASRFPDHILELKQISNLLNAACQKAREEVNALGGDIHAVLSKLQELKEIDPRWDWDVLLDEKQTFIDILINDNTYHRNQYGYPLNIGIGIDNFRKTRNLWYAIHRTEDTETHNWVL